MGILRQGSLVLALSLGTDMKLGYISIPSSESFSR